MQTQGGYIQTKGYIVKRRDLLAFDYEKVYVQVCRTIPEDSDRETENLKEIRDHYHKYVVAMDKLAIGNDEGIAFVHIADFLLMDKW